MLKSILAALESIDRFLAINVPPYRFATDPIRKFFQARNRRPKSRSRSDRFYDPSGRSMFDNEGMGAVRTSVGSTILPFPDVPAQIRPPPPWPVHSKTPVVDKMRKAAALQIFDILGLNVAPGQLWRFVAAEQDPGIAIGNFLAAIGLDFEAIRNFDRREQRRANELLDLLVEIDTSFSRLTREAIANIEKAVFSGNFFAVREAVEIVSLYERIARQSESWPDDYRFPAADAFIYDVRNELDNPMSASLSEARYAEKIAFEISDLVERFARCDSQQIETLNHIASIDPAVWKAWPEGPHINSGVVEYSTLQSTLTKSPLSLAEIATLIDHLEVLVEALSQHVLAGLGRATSSGKGTSGTSGSSSSSGPRGGSSSTSKSKATKPTQLDKAFEYFGFSGVLRPSFEEVRKARSKKVRETHPDTGGSDAAFRECSEYWDSIKSHYGRT